MKASLGLYEMEKSRSLALSEVVLDFESSTVPFVCPPHTLSPIPKALCAPGLVDVVHRDKDGLGLPAGQ